MLLQMQILLLVFFNSAASANVGSGSNLQKGSDTSVGELESDSQDKDRYLIPHSPPNEPMDIHNPPAYLFESPGGDSSCTSDCSAYDVTPMSGYSWKVLVERLLEHERKKKSSMTIRFESK